MDDIETNPEQLRVNLQEYEEQREQVRFFPSSLSVHLSANVCVMVGL